MSDEGRQAIEEFDEHRSELKITKKEIIPVFGNYVTRNQGFVEYLRGIKDQIETYVNRPSVKRPLNILLAAAPGSGKSFLIKQLIESVKSGIVFEEVYVPSLENVSQLYSVFQRIQSINLEGKIPAIFFDEIDSQLGSTTLYPKFLAPMWDGTFYLGKEKFFLGKSVFFFAGSTLSLEDKSEKILKRKGLISYDNYFKAWKQSFDEHVKTEKNKLHDFIDRVDAIIRIPPIRKALLGDNWKLEYEDVACVLVLKTFPEVRIVGDLALRVICNALLSGGSVRTAEKIVFNSKPADPEFLDISSLPKLYRANDLSLVGPETSAYEISLAKPPLDNRGSSS